MRTLTSLPRMYANQHGLKPAELSEELIGIFLSVYNELDGKVLIELKTGRDVEPSGKASF